MSAPPELLIPETAENILSNAVLTATWLRGQSSPGGLLNALDDDTFEVLKEAGLFRMSMPGIYGGPEMSFLQQAQVVEQLAEANIGAAWLVATGSDAGVYSGFLENHIARNLFPHLDVVQAGSIYPSGIAEEVAGGYKVSGNWMYIGDLSRADMVAAGCIVHRSGKPVYNQDGVPRYLVALAPLEHWKLSEPEQGGGERVFSTDYTTLSSYLLVPAGHCFSFLHPERAELAGYRPERILSKLVGAPLGAGRQAIRLYRETLEAFVASLRGSPEPGIAVARSLAAQAEMRLGSARSYVHECQQAYLSAFEAGEVTPEIAHQAALARVHAFHTTREICRLLADATIEQAGFRSRRLNAVCDDVETMCRHFSVQSFDPDTAGLTMLGSVGIAE